MDVGLVCDACSALTPIGVPQCARCGAAVALDPRPNKQSRPPPAKKAICSKCGTDAGEQVLKHGDYVFLGQQLLRVEIV